MKWYVGKCTTCVHVRPSVGVAIAVCRLVVILCVIDVFLSVVHLYSTSFFFFFHFQSTTANISVTSVTHWKRVLRCVVVNIIIYVYQIQYFLFAFSKKSCTVHGNGNFVRLFGCWKKYATKKKVWGRGIVTSHLHSFIHRLYGCSQYHLITSNRIHCRFQLVACSSSLIFRGAKGKHWHCIFY